MYISERYKRSLYPSDILSLYKNSFLKLAAINHSLSLLYYLFDHLLKGTNDSSNLNFIYCYNKISALTTEYMKYVKIYIYVRKN